MLRMKNPKALFPFLFASSWLGTLFLTILAFYLAFTHDGPLSPLIFFTVALCILSGNALPISVYWILVRWHEAELKAEAAEATLRVRDALGRSEEIIARLDEAEGALAKSVLLARQVPERIKSSFEQMDALAGKLDTLELTSFTEALQGQGKFIRELKHPLDAVQGSVEEVKAGLEGVRKDVKGVPATLGTLLEKVSSTHPAAAENELDISMGERLDLVFETLEGVQDSLDGLLQRIAELAVPVSRENPDPIGEPEVIEEPVAEEPDLPAEPEDIPVETEPEPPVAKKKKAKRQKKPSKEKQMMLSPESGQRNGPEASDGMTRLIAHAMIGMQNKLYIRGDEPWLSWDDGQQMELIGIGEFAWTMPDLDEPIDVTILLNDQFPAEGESVRLVPGNTIRINPVFPNS
jgi:hypothetical protein